ncbi:DUF3307 domain-containing protein [Candidatus Peregrinibacteria bacterium]|nr:DUF3307 domain-containing protein [Candidatus Peregrinibacteria bacterium]
MIFSYLILGHLLGDFILQPAKLVEWKMRSKKGIFVHALIHFITNLVIFSPLIYNGYTAMIPISFGVSFIHFWIDSAKISYDLRHDNKVTPFVLDQLLHLVVIIMAYAVSLKYAFQIPNTDFFRFYANFVIINFMSLIIFASMF